MKINPESWHLQN